MIMSVHDNDEYDKDDSVDDDGIGDIYMKKSLSSTFEQELA